MAVGSVIMYGQLKTKAASAGNAYDLLTDRPIHARRWLMAKSSLSNCPQSIPAITSEYDYDPETGAVLVPLGGKKNPGRFALVDPEDAERVLSYRWCPAMVAQNGDRQYLYAVSSKARPSRYMHRFILGITDPKVKVDHINHNGLDNRRCNLRVGSHQQNLFNRRPNAHATSQYKGVHWVKSRERWRARIRFNGRDICIGDFEDEQEAAEAYDDAALMLFGSRAYLNFPAEGEVA